MSPADSGSPRAAHRQEHLQGPSSVPEPVPVPEQQELVPQPAPTPPNGLPVLPGNAPPREPSVLLVPPASVPYSPASARQVQLPSGLHKAVPDW